MTGTGLYVFSRRFQWYQNYQNRMKNNRVIFHLAMQEATRALFPQLHTNTCTNYITHTNIKEKLYAHNIEWYVISAYWNIWKYSFINSIRYSLLCFLMCFSPLPFIDGTDTNLLLSYQSIRQIYHIIKSHI